MNHPIEIFQSWYQEELEQSADQIPSACCLSTIGEDGYPNARFVSLKEVVDGAFLITGPTDSLKGLELKKDPKAALTFWWTATSRQIRIQGEVSQISEEMATRHFDARSQDSKIVSAFFNQGQELASFSQMKEEFAAEQDRQGNMPVPRPASWGGWLISPLRIEFMQFQASRLHERRLFLWEGGQWGMRLLQP